MFQRLEVAGSSELVDSNLASDDLSSQELAAHFRGRRIKYAVITSIGSKLSTASLQALSLPIAVNALGETQFALYAMLMVAMAWISFANLGIGPVLTAHIADSVAKGDRGKEGRLMASGFLITSLAVVTIAGFCFVIVYNGYAVSLFGENYVDEKITIRQGLYVTLAFAWLYPVFLVIESAQAGYQEQFICNFFGMLGNFGGAIAIIIIALTNPSVVGLIIAVQAPLCVFRLCNVVYFFVSRPHVVPRWRLVDFPTCSMLVANGLGFSLAGSIGNFMCHSLPVFLVGRSLSPDDAAAVAASFTAIVLSLGVLSMITVPISPAITDSLARSDYAWARRAYKRALLLCMIYAAGIGATFAFFGRQVFRIWSNSAIDVSTSICFLIGVYLVLAVWERVHFVVLLGMKRFVFAGVLYFTKAALSTVLTSIFIWYGVVSGPYLALCIAIVLTTIIPYTIAVRRDLASTHLASSGTSSASPAGTHAKI